SSSDRRGQGVAALPPRHLAVAVAGHIGDRIVLGDPNLRRFSIGICINRRRTGKRNATLRDLRVPDWHRHRPAKPGGNDFAGRLPGIAARRHRAAALHPPGGDPLTRSIDKYSFSAPASIPWRGGEGRGEVGDSRALPAHLTLPRGPRGPLPLPPEGRREAF